MKRKLLSLLLVLALMLAMLAGCGANDVLDTLDAVADIVEALDEVASDVQQTASPQTPKPAQTPAPAPEPEPEPADAEDSPASPEETNALCGYPKLEESAPDVSEDGEYSDPESVALYIHTFGHLPGNFITKNDAKALGWDSSKGNLWDVAPGTSIGGDRFGNYEGILPKGRYTECDVNYSGGYRGAERIIFSDDGRIYYTADHYESFDQLY